VVFTNAGKKEFGQYKIGDVYLDGKNIEDVHDTAAVIPASVIDGLGDGKHIVVVNLI
jgi:hypothetical protein